MPETLLAAHLHRDHASDLDEGSSNISNYSRNGTQNRGFFLPRVFIWA